MADIPRLGKSRPAPRGDQDVRRSADVRGGRVLCGAEYGQVSDERVNHRNGYSSREWDMRAGTIELTVPRETLTTSPEAVIHIAFGTAGDGRLFFNEHGGIVGSSTYDGVWHEARELALPPDLVSSPLPARPYDLRHSALWTWLNAGVDPAEVADRAGNSVEVLINRCDDGPSRRSSGEAVR
ncbi:transposase [Streptomyces sp. NPDC087787]|uniref:transposase n=1 Tax=Streptomyces sp. NPDC087787 TaxID=3365803 RepID=UPI0038064AE1